MRLFYVVALIPYTRKCLCWELFQISDCRNKQYFLSASYSAWAGFTETLLWSQPHLPSVLNPEIWVREREAGERCSGAR